MNKYYTGVGAREAPEEILKEIQIISMRLSTSYTLRSGGAEGCDSAFENGIDLNSRVNFDIAQKEIFLPWKGFNDNTSNLYNIPDEAFDIASKYYPNWETAKHSVRKLHARNVQQVLGLVPGKSIPSSFLVCWSNRPEDQWRGTMFAVNLAKLYSIPTYNLYYKEQKEKFYKEIFN